MSRFSATSVAIALAVTAGASLLTPAPASAAGCGGYVNVFVSGCAPWDNNARRMPGAPGYQAPRPTVQQPARLPTPTIAARTQPTPVIAPSANRLISDRGGGIISNDGGGLRARGNILSDQGGGLRR